MESAEDIGLALARAAVDQVEEMTRAAILGHLNVAPLSQGPTLTIEGLLAAQDRFWDTPDEPYWYLCRAEDATKVRAAVGEDYPGKRTCPIVRLDKVGFCARGKMLQIEWGEYVKEAARRQGRR